jgi:hypothetical protein
VKDASDAFVFLENLEAAALMISALQTSTHPFLMSLGSTFGSGNDQVINVTEKSHPHVDLASTCKLTGMLSGVVESHTKPRRRLKRPSKVY